LILCTLTLFIVTVATKKYFVEFILYCSCLPICRKRTYFIKLLHDEWLRLRFTCWMFILYGYIL